MDSGPLGNGPGMHSVAAVGIWLGPWTRAFQDVVAIDRSVVHVDTRHKRPDVVFAWTSVFGPWRRGL